jgi:hypothetical protein
MTLDDSLLLGVLVAVVLVPFAIVLWRIREEARETRARLDAMEGRLRQRFRQRFEHLEAQFAELQDRLALRGGEIEEEPSQGEADGSVKSENQ